MVWLALLSFFNKTNRKSVFCNSKLTIERGCKNKKIQAVVSHGRSLCYGKHYWHPKQCFILRRLFVIMSCTFRRSRLYASKERYSFVSIAPPPTPPWKSTCPVVLCNPASMFWLPRGVHDRLIAPSYRRCTLGLRNHPNRNLCVHFRCCNYRNAAES